MTHTPAPRPLKLVDPTGTRQADDEDPRVHVMKSMMMDRGWLVNSYAQVEFLLGDLIWQLRSFPEYSTELHAFPLSLDGRVARVTEFCQRDGPLRAHSNDILPLFDRLAQLDEGRQFFVHGYCAFYSTPAGDMAMQFRRFVPPAKGEKKGPVRRKDLIVRPAELAAARDRWALFADTSMKIFRGVYQALRLEEPDLLPIERA